MKKITEQILGLLSTDPKKNQPSVLKNLTPTDSLFKWTATENEERNIELLRLLKYYSKDKKGVLYLNEEDIDQVEDFNKFNVEAYLVGETEALEYINNKYPNLHRYYTELFTQYLIVYEGKHQGVLYPREKVIKIYDTGKDREIINKLEEETFVYKPAIEHESFKNSFGRLQLTNDTLLNIEKMERAQGYNFNTTILKKAVGLNYFADYQIHLLEQWDKYQDFFIIGGRRIGKTYLQIYVILRELMIPNSTIIYAAPDSGMFEQAFLYLTRFKNEVDNFAQQISSQGGKFETSFVLRRSENSLENTANGSVIWFLSGEKRHGLRSQEAHLVVIDEAAFMKHEEYINLSVMVGQNRGYGRGKMFCITTINPKTPKNWYFEEYMKGVLKEDDYFSMRIPMTQSPFRTKREIDKLLLKCKGDANRIKTEVYAEFPDSNNRINEQEIFYSDEESLGIEKIMVNEHRFYINKKNINSGSVIVIGYDPAKKISQIGLVILNIFTNKEGKRIVEICGEGDLIRGTGYIKQIEYFFAIHNYVKPLCRDVILGIDENGIGATIYEMINQYGNVKMMAIHTVANSLATSSGRGIVSSYTKKNNIYYIKYDYLQELPSRLVETGNLKSYKFSNILKDIIALNSTTEDNNRKLQNKIDYWNALCIGCFVATQIEKEITRHEREMAKPKRFYDPVLERFKVKELPKRKEGNEFIY